jgi:hypothetical protein
MFKLLTTAADARTFFPYHFQHRTVAKIEHAAKHALTQNREDNQFVKVNDYTWQFYQP